MQVLPWRRDDREGKMIYWGEPSNFNKETDILCLVGWRL